MSKFLKMEDLIDFSDTGYEEAVVKLLHDKGITIDDFQYVGKCDSECPNCEAESFSVWRQNIGFIKDKEAFTLDLEEIETDDVLDFAIYLCNKCGKWTTYIE